MPIIDPVCKRDIDDVEYPEQLDYEGYTYWFSSLEDAQEFTKHPEKYADEQYGEKKESGR